jgi:hypothetical protein
MKSKTEIEKKYFPAISRFFTPKVLDNLALNGYSSYLSEVSLQSGLYRIFDLRKNLKEFFDFVYKILFENYRSEYIYKNEIANKILLGRHSLNTSRLLTEFRIGKTKADIVILNGSSTVYEIKSEYDTFFRLETQIKTYLKIFEYVNVITSPKLTDKIFSITPSKVGILELTDKNTISTKRKAESNRDNMNPEVFFDSLRKPEYLSIIKNYYGEVPDVPNTMIYNECKKLFCQMPTDKIHKLTNVILSGRQNVNKLNEFLKVAPYSLSAYAFSFGKNKMQMNNLLKQLNKNANSLIIQ